MKKFTHILLITIISCSSVFAIGGIGVYAGQGLFTVGSLVDDSNSAGTVSTGEFSNPFQGGLYLYIDAIPFIDIEADIQLTFSEYTFDFVNSYGSAGPFDAYWGGASTYLTLRKKIFGLGIPVLGGAKIHAGAGYNMHSFAPLAELGLVEDIMGGSLNSKPEFSEDDLIDFVKENKIDVSGFHIQTGLQFKLLALDTFLIYRYTIGEFDDVIDASSFGSLNLRFGLGI